MKSSGPVGRGEFEFAGMSAPLGFIKTELNAPDGRLYDSSVFVGLNYYVITPPARKIPRSWDSNPRGASRPPSQTDYNS